MWSHAGRRSVLDRAKAQLSGQRISNNGIKDKRDVENSGKLVSPSKKMQFQDLSDVFSLSECENQDPVKTTTLESFSMGGGSRFLKKTSKDATATRLSSAPRGTPAGTEELKFIPQRSSQSTALSKLALIENRIRNQKSRSNGPSIHTNLSDAQETRLSVQSSSDLSMTGSRFLKKRTVSASQEENVPERISGLNEHKERRVSLDSDEQDMQRLLGDSFSLSESSLQHVVRQKSPQPVKKLYKSSEKFTIPSPAPLRHKVLSQSLSPPPSRTESRMVRFTERSVSSESDHSEIQSLDNLFPDAAAPDSDDTLSERSAASDDFKLKVMTLDDLAPIPFEAAVISQEKKETQARTEDRNKKSSNNISKVASTPTSEDASAAYESDFESEIPSETPQSISEISECLTDKDKDASLIREAQYSSYKSQDGDDNNDRTFSQSSSSSLRSDSSSRSSSSNATVTHGPSPDRNVKEVAIQTQADGLTYTWSSGMAAVGPSLGMTYVDPTPIASHTVSAEAIESLTAYSPAIFALNDMLRQQLALTRAFVDSTRRHYTSVIEALEPADYKYTTLEDTKEFIRAHRPPKLSIEDALEEVLQEMRDYHYS